MARKSYEELVQLKQEEKIGWLEFVQLGDSAKDFAVWCEEHNVEQTEEYAALFVEQTEERLWEEQEGEV